MIAPLPKDEIRGLVVVHTRRHPGSWDAPTVRMGADCPAWGGPHMPILFTCPVCRTGYATREEAERCRDTPPDTGGLQVGDLVIIPGERIYPHVKVTWSHWVAYTQPANPDSPSHFDHEDTRHLWWVVTHLGPGDRNPHRMVASVCTLAAGELWAGWNPANGHGHHALYRAGVPREQQLAAGSSTWWDEIGELVLAARPTPELLAEAQALAEIRIAANYLL